MKIIFKRPLDRDTRIITKFLFFPVRIKDEWRWLEVASIKQMYVYPYGWYNVGWS